MPDPTHPTVWQRSSIARFLRWMFSRRGLRVLLIALVWIVTIIALLYAEENWRGRRIWNKYRAELEARGEQLDLKAFIPKDVPAPQNFATTPFIESWFDRGLNAEQRWLDDYSRVASAPGSPREKGQREFTDLVAWAKALEAARAGEKTKFEPSHQLDSASRAKAAPAVLEGLKTSDPKLNELRDASQRPFARYPVFYNLENPWGILLPHLASIKASCQRLQLRASAELAAGQTNKALEDVKLILYLADSMKEEPFLISYLVRVACLKIATQPIWEGLAEHRWSDADLAAISAPLQQYNFVADMKRPLDSERAAGILTAELLYTKKYHLNELLGEAEELSVGSVAANVCARIAPHGWYYQEQYNFAKLFELQREGTVDGPARRVFPKQVATQAKKLEGEVSGGRLGKTLNGVMHHKLVAAMLLPSLEAVPRRAATAQTAADHAMLACALERYRLARREYPAELRALVPQFISQLPNDVFTGAPCQYRRADGGYVLYSVGWNQQDDGGETGKTLFDDRSGDWVWDYPSHQP